MLAEKGVESSLIVKYLDDAFPEPPMRPADAAGRYRVDSWLMHLDEVLHPAAPVVTFALGPRKALLKEPKEVREAKIAAIPDPVQRATRRSVLDHGVRSNIGSGPQPGAGHSAPRFRHP